MKTRVVVYIVLKFMLLTTKTEIDIVKSTSCNFFNRMISRYLKVKYSHKDSFASYLTFFFKFHFWPNSSNPFFFKNVFTSFFFQMRQKKKLRILSLINFALEKVLFYLFAAVVQIFFRQRTNLLLSGRIFYLADESFT